MQEVTQFVVKKRKHLFFNDAETVENKAAPEISKGLDSTAQKHKHKRCDAGLSAETERKRKVRVNAPLAEEADEIKAEDKTTTDAKKHKRTRHDKAQTVSNIEGETVTINQIQAKHFHQTLLSPSEPVHENEINPIISNLPDKNIYFVGRKRKIRKVKSLLKEYQRCAIVGTGGVGKTQLAKEYAHHFQESYKIIWWICGSSIINDYIELAKSFNNETVKLGIKQRIFLENRSPKEIINDLRKILQTLPSWLIIFDDVEQEEDILEYLPQVQSETNSKHIIMTSRNQHWQTFHPLPLEVLDRPGSITLLETIISGELNNTNKKN